VEKEPTFYASWFSFRSPFFPTLIFLGFFFLLPLVVMFGISFGTRGIYGGVEWILTWSNYGRLADPLYGNIYLRSVLFAGLTTLVCLILGFPLAYAIARAPQHWQPLLFMLVLIPFWTNFLVRTYAWFFILRADGLINSLLIGLGFISQPLEILYTDFAVFIGLVYGYLPFMVVPLVIVIERIPHTLEEAAKDLYATPWSTVWRVILPLSKPGIIGGCVLVFIPTLGAFITPYLLGGGRSMLLGTLIQQEFLVIRDWPFGAAISFVLMGMVFLALLATRKHAEMVGQS
jgi:spermidine/putrescine transport system permease protein